MNSPEDQKLVERFAQLRSEDQSGAPDFADLVARARDQKQTPAQRRTGITRPLWKALPAGAVLAAAGIAALALFTPDAAEVEFREAVAWLESDPVFGSASTPSDVLLETPGWTLLKSGSSLRGLSDALGSSATSALGLPSERNES